MERRYYGIVVVDETARPRGSRALVEFPEAPGCQTFVEPTEEVTEVAREALQGWLEAHEEGGRELPEPSVTPPEVPEGAYLISVAVEVPD